MTRGGIEALAPRTTELLDAAGGEVGTAVLVGRPALDAAAARARIAATEGDSRRGIDEQ